jgi:RNA polymerase sigma factor (sigma-70 family)
VNSLTDQQLLRDYTGRRSEAAFDELVRRHVDFIYSAALRMVRDAHLAEDVTQGVFVALAQNARQLTERPVLSGWLHRTAQNLAANAVRSEVRRRACEQEAAAMNELLEPDAVWERIAPHLDAALGELSEADRDALLLRYFERKSAREMAQTLGTSEDAAQKRVSRAVERLRECLAKRGITIGASGLGVVLSANAVQAAPVGLSGTVSTAAALAGAAIQTSTTIAAAKAVAMTTMHKPATLTMRSRCCSGSGVSGLSGHDMEDGGLGDIHVLQFTFQGGKLESVLGGQCDEIGVIPLLEAAQRAHGDPVKGQVVRQESVPGQGENGFEMAHGLASGHPWIAPLAGRIGPRPGEEAQKGSLRLG